ncbi:cytoplasmic dynein 2 intermediate chain 1 isoform X1 [Hylaeus volcanicus]|uniref:cytoplasmic dynein 2 intermediate chain 1 isoform X1 n=1 Tax=Hylaeus volcanicus TaxID=313075 RepID=UPI0023B8558D|nr:cytoplasmic dynein 2 intermediate chain 1 isoform X1 [Hylaeus volcanicus]
MLIVHYLFQGAIKKVSITKNAHQSTKSKSKSSSSTKESESSEKLDLKLMKKSAHSERRGEGDRHSRLVQNVSSDRGTTKRSTALSQNKSVRESSSSTSKLNISSKTSVTSKTASDPTRKLSRSDGTKSSKSSGRIQSSYSEKRGLTTVFVPSSVTNKLNSKSVNKETYSVLKEKAMARTNPRASEKSDSKMKSRQRKLSRTLSPSEVRVLHSAKPRSDSLQKDQNNKNKSEMSQIENEYDYEDDFEDYESDFQECTDSETSEVSEESSSSHNNLPPLDPIELHTTKQRKVVNNAEQQKEEEHMHDSGHYELAEARRRAARVEAIANDPKLASLIELKQPVNKAFSEDRLSESKSLPLSTDEGFEDSRSGDFTKSPPLSQISFIDFRKTKENQRAKKSKKSLSRGEELLEMIKLDVMEWSLLECSPIPYEEFIRNYGKLNTQQISTQTGEDNIDVETQTDKIMFKNKWTQFPITCRSNLQTKEDLNLFQMDQIGVGDDNEEETMNFLPRPTFDVLRLSDFLSRAGKIMLSLLEERRSGGNLFKNEEQVPFSDGVVKLSVNSVTFLAGRAVTIIHYSEVLNKVLVTIHASTEEEIETSNKQDYITDCCIGCIWSISEPSMPMKLFYSTCPITACCFHLTNYNVVFAGLQDGSISLWDLKEDEMWHQKMTDTANELNWTIRTPTYTTAANIESNIHDSPIVTIRILSKIEEKSLERCNNKFVPIQICSLNEKGSLIIWSVLHSMGINVDDLGLSYWGSIRLVKSQELLLQSDTLKKRIDAAAFIDMHVDCVDSNNLYIATNGSTVLHATCIGNKASPAMYKKLDTSACGNVTCIDMCPFDQSFFLVGCDDGTLRLHSLNTEKPILQLRDEDNIHTIKSVQWSKSKPFTIFVLDNNSRIHIWDLTNSDIYSTYSVSMQKCGFINSMQLSSCKTERDMSHQYLALGTESGNVEIHKLKTNFCYSKKEDYLQELNTFMRYVAIL